jgi:hypothetical protein
MLPTGAAFLLHEGKPEDGQGPNSGGTSKWSRVEVWEGQMALSIVASDTIFGGTGDFWSESSIRPSDGTHRFGMNVAWRVLGPASLVCMG